MTKKNIALWSGPRNLSTALMYSFINRGDCKAYDEPLFGYFLKQTGVWRPSRDYLKKNNQPYLLIEAKDIKRNSELALKALCDFCDITFTDKMLKWASGKRSEDGPWDKYWYQNVHKSTAFISSESTTFDDSEYRQNKMYQKVVKQYQQLVEHKPSNQ